MFLLPQTLESFNCDAAGQWHFLPFPKLSSLSISLLCLMGSLQAFLLSYLVVFICEMNRLESSIVEQNVLDMPTGLVVLTLPSITKFEQTSIKHLPRTLTFLSLHLTSNMSGPYLADLPPRLREFRCNRSTEITDADLKLLPRTITALSLAVANLTKNALFDLDLDLKVESSIIGRFGVSPFQRKFNFKRRFLLGILILL